MGDGSGSKNLINSYSSFSGSDHLVYMGYIGTNDLYQADEVQTISYSIHRDTDHARSLGYDLPRGLVKGQAIVAGTIVLTVLNRRVLKDLANKASDMFKSDGTDGQNNDKQKFFRLDQIPPFDILIVQGNDYGMGNYILIYGAEIVNEGQVASVHDIYTENTVNYVAKGIYYGDGFTANVTSGKTVLSLTCKMIEEGNEAVKEMLNYFL